MIDKTPLGTKPTKFDLKFMLVSDAGAGKTHFCGSYTGGPVHFYMLDPGGEKTLYKLNQNRPAHSPITVDLIDCNKQTYDDFWNLVQQDAEAGFFDDMADKNGLVVFPDSLTTANEMAMREIARLNKREMLSQKEEKKFGFRKQDWGQMTQWMSTLVNVINTLPCATACTAHLFTELDKENTPIARYPKIMGQLRYSIGKSFDEVYLLEAAKAGVDVYFKRAKLFTAKTRTFAIPMLRDADMNIIAQAYQNNDDLSSKGGDNKSNPNHSTTTPKVNKMLLPGS